MYSRKELRAIGAKLAAENAPEADAMAAAHFYQKMRATVPASNTGVDPADEAFEYWYAVKWARNGFPLVTTSHLLAALLMATSVSEDLLPEIELPWDTFMIVVPDGLLDFHEDDRHWQLSSVLVRRELDGSIHFTARKEQSHAHLSFRVMKLAELFQKFHFIDSDPPERSRRVAQLLIRYILGVCIELDQPKYREQLGKGAPVQNLRKHGEPSSWTFMLTRDVKVDCRPWIVNYLAGNKATSPSVQTLVRGHHKLQPFGPGRRERKWIHVSPYWRGPEDAPIAVRKHIL